MKSCYASQHPSFTHEHSEKKENFKKFWNAIFRSEKVSSSQYCIQTFLHSNNGIFPRKNHVSCFLKGPTHDLTRHDRPSQRQRHSIGLVKKLFKLNGFKWNFSGLKHLTWLTFWLFQNFQVMAFDPKKLNFMNTSFDSILNWIKK